MNEEINEGNCVLSENDLKHINHALEDFVEMNDVNRKARKWAERKREKLFQKIEKLNEMAKQAKDKINHNDYIRHDTAPF